MVDIPISMHQEVYESFGRPCCDIMSALYTNVHEVFTLERKKGCGKFPQSVTVFPMVSKAPGSHPTGFKPYFTSTFYSMESSTTRRLRAINNMPYLKHAFTEKKVKSPFRVN